jgi:hypothetical protein
LFELSSSFSFALLPFPSARPGLRTRMSRCPPQARLLAVPKLSRHWTSSPLRPTPPPCPRLPVKPHPRSSPLRTSPGRRAACDAAAAPGLVLLGAAIPPAGPCRPAFPGAHVSGGREQGWWAPAAHSGTHGAPRPAEPGAGPGRGSRLQPGANFAAGRGVAGTRARAGGGGGRGPCLCARVAGHHAVGLSGPDSAGAFPQPSTASPGPAAAAVPPVPRQVGPADPKERHHRRLQGHQPSAWPGHQREGAADLRQENPAKIRPKGKSGPPGIALRSGAASGHPASGRHPRGLTGTAMLGCEWDPAWWPLLGPGRPLLALPGAEDTVASSSLPPSFLRAQKALYSLSWLVGRFGEVRSLRFP